jgi:hypothetical protein
MMDRICFFVLALIACPVQADDAMLPASVPPFALGDFCVATVVDRNGTPVINIDMFELRSRNVEVSADIAVSIDGRVANRDTFVHDTFSPTRRRSIASSLDGFSFWDANGNKLKREDLAVRLATRTRAVMVNRDIAEGDIEFLRYFGDDVLFIHLGQLAKAAQSSER